MPLRPSAAETASSLWAVLWAVGGQFFRQFAGGLRLVPEFGLIVLSAQLALLYQLFFSI